MQSLSGNTTSRSSRRARNAHDSHRHNPIGPSRTRLVNRHNPYATTVSQPDTDGLTPKGQYRNRSEGRPRPLARRSSAMASSNDTWEGVSQNVSYHRLPESTPAPTPTSTLPEIQPDYAPVCASTTVLPPPPTTPRLVARDLPLDEFGLYSFLQYEDNYGSNFFDSFDLGYSASYSEQIVTPAHGAEEEEVPRTIPRPPTPHPEPVRRSAGKINLSSLHHRVMRSKGYVPDVSLDQLVGAVRKQILQQADRLMFEYQAKSREQRKWRGYREPEDDGLLKRPKKVRFNPCSTEGRNRKKRSVNYGVDELARQVNRIQLTA